MTERTNQERIDALRRQISSLRRKDKHTLEDQADLYNLQQELQRALGNERDRVKPQARYNGPDGDEAVARIHKLFCRR